jgi:UPF0755 protein
MDTMTEDNKTQDKPAPKFGLFSRKEIRSPGEALQPDAPPPPPPPPKRKRREGMLSLISAFLSLLLVAAIASVVGFSLAQQKLRAPGPLASDKLLYFPARTDVPDILAKLESDGVIDAPILMNMALWLEGNRGNVKAGEYLFKKEASLRDVMDMLVAGRVYLHAITIPEGLTSEQILQRLRDNDVLAGDLREAPKEGLLLPETYRVPRGMSRGDLIRKMQDDQRRLVDQIWAKRDPNIPLRTPHELVTLASIVEKETGRADERPRVASVFINRLQKRMKLQSDPTIVYGLVGGKGTLGRGITRAEISAPSPYNTYVIEGLPPGPIANPGRAALEAVANPAKTSDLFFVADGTGGHAFAETLDEHNRNVARWREIEKERGTNDRAPAVAPGDPGVPDVRPKNVAPPRGQRGALEEPGPGHALVDALPRMEEFGVKGRFGVAGPMAREPGPAQILAARIAEAKKLAARNPKFDSFAETVVFKTPERKPKIELDGEEDLSELADSGVYPVDPRLLADQRERAARLGLTGGLDLDTTALPSDALAMQPVQSTSAARKIYDASEGTALDPLRKKGWDLNSAKRVPESSTRAATP